MPSAAADGVGIGFAHHPERVEQASGRSEDRHEECDLQRPRTCIGVDANDLVLNRLGLIRELLVELRVAHDLGVIVERLRDLLLLGRWEHGARLGHAGERERQRRQHDRSGKRQAERQPERATGGVDAGGFADSFLRDRSERVVVELRHQQARARILR